MAEQSMPLLPAEIAQLLRSSLVVLEGQLSLVPAWLLSWHPSSGEWCIKEVVGHLIEAEERGFSGRIRTILSLEAEPIFEGWDPDEVARGRRDCERELGDLLAEFRGAREASIELVGQLDPADLQRGGQHPKVGYLRVGDLLQEWVFHDQNHLRQMAANIQSSVWPHMGNAQRFY